MPHTVPFDYEASRRETAVAQLARRPAKALYAAIRLTELLTFKRASFGFEHERVTPPRGQAPVDPTTYIVETTRPYLDSWVLPELNATVGLTDKFAAETFDQLREWCSAALVAKRG